MKFYKIKNGIGDYIDVDWSILHAEIKAVYNDGWCLHGGENKIVIDIIDGEIDEQTVSDVVLLHGSQEKVDERVAEKEAEEIETGNLKNQLLNLVDNMTFDKIDTHIENAFGNLSANQKTSLKNLYKVVLFMAKRAR